MQLINKLQQITTGKDLLKGNFGIEREGLRCTSEGKLAMTPHPEVFGEKLAHPYITTDFSESQLEFITPTVNTLEEAYDYLNILYNMTVLEMGNEYIWPQSMPCVLSNEKIPVATFADTKEGLAAMNYRHMLVEKYGAKKQLISGIHYNFSFEESLLKKLYAEEEQVVSYKVFKDQIYLKMTRNYLRYRWLLIYLLGSTSVVHHSYVEGECMGKLEEVGEAIYSNEGAISYRNSECGYNNKTELFPNYNTVMDYVESLKQFIANEMIDSPKELYSPIRLKARDPQRLSESLIEEGICYLEYRNIDINPFDKAGIARNDLYFVHLFNLYLLVKEEEQYDKWQEEAFMNQRQVARFGGKSLELSKNGSSINQKKWGVDILNEMIEMCKVLDIHHTSVLEEMKSRVMDPSTTYAYRLYQEVLEKGYVASHLQYAEAYKESAYSERYKTVGYEDMELSTQILIKEAIKRGIKVKVIDRKDQFVALTKDDNTHYIKQATKTALDSYMTVLMMENKIVTKKILETKNIRVPMGADFDSLQEALGACRKYVDMPVVIKPKSTNFGLGISIFPQGGSKEDLSKAFQLAFEYDETVLLEEFIQGKEYRFLVIGEEVVGILHRVPANVIGDGSSTIRMLVEKKNEDSLRGKGYRTPLEKIQLDEAARLFLKQQKLDFDSVIENDKRVYLRENSNISTGGDSIDYTDVMPTCFKQIAVEAAKAVGAKICGVDMMLEDYTNPQTPYGIIELNFNPAIHIHSYPFEGRERNIAAKVLDVLGF